MAGRAQGNLVLVPGGVHRPENARVQVDQSYACSDQHRNTVDQIEPDQSGADRPGTETVARQSNQATQPGLQRLETSVSSSRRGPTSGWC